MKSDLHKFNMRVSKNLFDKLHYIAEYEGRTNNKELEQMIKIGITQFEKSHGEIQLDEDNDDENDSHNFILRVSNNLFDKLQYISKYEGRTNSKEIEQMIKRRIAHFEKIHGKIQLDENNGDV